MLKVKAFLNDPCGPTWQRVQEILPRLGQKYQIEWETVFKSREEYQSEAYKASGLPRAAAVMVEDEMAGQGPGLSEERLEAVIRRHSGLP